MRISPKARLLCLLVALPLLLTGCGDDAGKTAHSPTPAATLALQEGYQKYTAYFYDAFDTVTVLTGFAESQAAFDGLFEQAHAMMLRYHAMFDIYKPHAGVNGLYHLNKNAKNGPVAAEPEVVSLLQWLKDMQPKADGRVNVAMGAVLSLWHDARQEGVSLPPVKLLENAALHTNFDNVVIDSGAGTVYFADPALRLDMGAVAKGYAVEAVAKWLLTTAMPSYIISSGGNVRCGEKPLDGRARWGVSIQDPDAANGGMAADAGYLDVLYIANLSAVTSGDYQRFYTVDGAAYHHIIDPDTLYPANHVRAVTIVAQDSALADFLSTAVFLMPYEKGLAFVEGIAGVEAYWVLPDGETRATDGMRAMLRSNGASAMD